MRHLAHLFSLSIVCLAGCPDTGTPPGTDSGMTAMDAPATPPDAPGPETPGPSDTGPDSPLPIEDAPGTDAPSATDAPSTTDAPVVGDAGPMCSDTTMGSCSAAGTTCECCPAGGPLQRCVCTTTCTSAADCTDLSRPICEIPPGSTTGFCRPATLTCCWVCG